MAAISRRRLHNILVIVGGLIVIQIVFTYFFLSYFAQCPAFPVRGGNLRQSGKLSIILRDFDPENHGLPSIIKSLSASRDVQRILIVTDDKMYPPFSMRGDKTEFVVLRSDAFLREAKVHVDHVITTEWVLLVPDMVDYQGSSGDLGPIMEEAERDHHKGEIRVWAMKVKGRRLSCHRVSYDYQRWSLLVNSTTNQVCDGVTGSVIFLMKALDFLTLLEPFGQPVDESLLVQAAAKGWQFKVLLGSTPFTRSKRLLEPEILTNVRDMREERMKKLYKTMAIKRTVKNGQEEIYGCSKTTPRCFGNIINEIPEYVHRGRYTPPCCVRNLRLVLEHIVALFTLNNVRYWLEGGSLLGAVRNGQLIPWDYDIDLGMDLNDTAKVQYLEAAKQGPVVDPEGFVWEMSQPHEGQFIRVQYSKTNRIHVDIFPFYSKNGTMTKDFWFKDHPQDKEFPESYLNPMESIGFMGITVPAPNRVREFVELKFGVGSIEKPRYPHDFNP